MNWVSFRKRFRERKSEVDAKIHRVLHQTLFQEQQLQLIDQKAAAQHRDIGGISILELINQMKKTEGGGYK